MLRREIWITFLILISILVGTSYIYVKSYVQRVSFQVEKDSEHRLIEKSDGTLKALESMLVAGKDDQIQNTLQLLSNGERLHCVTLIFGLKKFSYPVNCSSNSGTKVIEVSTKAGTVLRTETGLSLADELTKSLDEAFLVILLGFCIILFLFSSIFSISIRWLGDYFESTLEALVDGRETPIGKQRLFNKRFLTESIGTLKSRLTDLVLIQEQRSRDAAVVKIAAQLSHDLRSPLAVLRLLIPQVKFSNKDDSLAHEAALSRIHSIVETLLHGKDVIKPLVTQREFFLGVDGSEKVFLSVADSIERIIREKRLQTQTQILFQPLDFIEIEVNLIAWERVISNIITNSLEAMEKKNGLIEVKTEINENVVCVYVIDQGGGISNDLLSRIGGFGETFGKENGTGIGLSYAYEVIESWAGRLLLCSEPGVGTKVQIRLRGRFAPGFVPLDTKKRVIRIGGSTRDMDYFPTLAEFGRFYGKNFSDLESAVFHFSAEFAQEKVLEFVLFLGIHGQCLVDISVAEDPLIVQQYRQHGIKLNYIVKK